MDDHQFADLVRNLCTLPRETEWVEFKHNRADPEDMGEYISALANGAALAGKHEGYVIWGIEDNTHQIIGTSFNPLQAKIGAEELEGWLNRLLHPRVNFSFTNGIVDEKQVILLTIPRAIAEPIQFKGESFVRIGSYKKKLKDQPEKARSLWKCFDSTPFEIQIIKTNCTNSDILRLIEYPSYFKLLSIPLPEEQIGIIKALEADKIIVRNTSGLWDISRLGAVLLAYKLSDFPGMDRKAARVIQYRGTARIETIKDRVFNQGYACVFDTLISYINDLVPSNELIISALRQTVPMYPPIAVRELVANALIHQDLSINGTGPTIEIFSNRLEITNPGAPLVAPDRFLDIPPRSRNESLAGIMRRFGICEERGSGIDKVVFEIEYFQLPAPVFEASGNNIRAVLFSHRSLTLMDKEDRTRACYQHACLKYVSRETMTNSTVRKRFGIKTENIAQASRLIRDAVDAGAIFPFDGSAAPKQMRYVPWWVKDPGT